MAVRRDGPFSFIKSFPVFAFPGFSLAVWFDPQGAASLERVRWCPGHQLLFEHRIDVRAHDVLPDVGSRRGGTRPI